MTDTAETFLITGLSSGLCHAFATAALNASHLIIECVQPGQGAQG